MSYEFLPIVNSLRTKILLESNLGNPLCRRSGAGFEVNPQLNEWLTLRWTFVQYSLMFVPFRSISPHNPLNSYLAPNKRVVNPSLVTRFQHALCSLLDALLCFICLHMLIKAFICFICFHNVSMGAGSNSSSVGCDSRVKGWIKSRVHSLWLKGHGEFAYRLFLATVNPQWRVMVDIFDRLNSPCSQVRVLNQLLR